MNKLLTYHEFKKKVIYYVTLEAGTKKQYSEI